MTSSVRYEREDGIGWVVLDRPDTMNALGDTVNAEILACVQEANADRETRVVVLIGAGPHFSVGGDLNFEAGTDPADWPAVMRLSGHLTYELRNSPKPIIAAVRGYCVGGGHQLALHADLLVASETAKFSHTETRWGMLPFWGAAQALPLMTGERRAREVLLMGRLYDADQFLEMGLCTSVVPDDRLEDEVRALANELIERSAHANYQVRIALNGPSASMGALADHQILLTCVSAGAERSDQVATFFENKASRRPRRAGPRRRRSTDSEPPTAG